MRKLITATMLGAILGVVAIAATSDALSVTVTAGTNTQVSATKLTVQSVTFEADPAATGPYLYVVGQSGNNLGKIRPGQSYTPPLAGIGVDLSTLYVTGDHTGDKILVSYAQTVNGQ